jgi:hypothetical protein
MGRSTGRSNTKSLISQGQFSINSPRVKDTKKEVALKEDNIKEVLVPDKVLDDQIGVTLYRPGNRDEMLEILGNGSVQNSTNEDVVERLSNYIEYSKNLFDWANQFGFASELAFTYPGQAMEPMPKSNYHGLFLSTVLDFNPNNLNEDYLNSFNKDIQEILFSSLPIKDKLAQIKLLIYPSRFYDLLANTASPLDGDPLKIAFRKNS